MKYAKDPRPQLEFKVLRLQKPLLMLSHFPLHGEYNDINNNEDVQMFPLRNKDINFNIPNQQFPGVSNMLSINNVFGQIIEGEYFSALIIIYNKHPVQHAKISMPKMFRKINNTETPLNYVLLLNNDNKESQKEIKEFNLSPGEFELMKINESITKHVKYTFSLYLSVLSFEPANKGTKEKINSKLITHSKGFNFESLEPFALKEKIYNNNMKHFYIELRVENTSRNKLMIKHIEIFPELKKQMAINTSQIEQYNNILINAEETFNYILSTDNSKGFFGTSSFNVNIYWYTMFNSNINVLSKKIKNEYYNIDNECFSLKVVEQPNTIHMN